MFYLFIFLASLALTAIFTLIMRRIALAYKVVDAPDLEKEDSRKIHREPTPLLGGLFILVCYLFFLIIFWPVIYIGLT